MTSFNQWMKGFALTSSIGFGASLFAANPQILGLDDANHIKGQYVVVLKKDSGMAPLATDAAKADIELRSSRLAERFSGRILHQYSASLAGFSVRMSEDMATKLAQDPSVAFVEADRIVTLNVSQSNAPWGLDRVDSRSGLDGFYEYDYSGKGVEAYVIDTGLNSSHSDFTGRVGQGFSSINDGRGTEDCNGHGTHVSGTVAGSKYGLAKDATLFPVRVFGCNGSTTNSAILAGIDFVRKNATPPAVVNMSLGGGRSQALDDAVQTMIDAGIVTVVAAGNSNRDACGFSPAAVPDAITVGSSTNRDGRSSFSNYGRCVDIFAPGSSIQSAWINGSSASRSISGTSMASPHVAGAAALLLEQFPTATPTKIEELMLRAATTGTISNVGSGSPNLMLFTRFDFEGGEPTPPAPEPDPEDPRAL